MANLFCLNCGHEFPAEGARKKADPSGKIIFGSIGLLAILFGVACFVFVVPNAGEQRMDYVWYGTLGVIAGLISISIGLSLGKGLYSYCPACGKGMALPSDSNSAKHEKRKRGLS